MFSAFKKGSKSPPDASGFGSLKFPRLAFGFGKLTVPSFRFTAMRFVYVLGKCGKVTEAQKAKGAF